MISTFTFIVVLVAFGSLSLVMARPTASNQQGISEQSYYTLYPLYQQASKDVEKQADAATVDQIIDAYNTYLRKQLQSAEKQGRSISWRRAKQQAPQFAKEEGVTFTYPESWYNEQAKGQRFTYDIDFPFIAKKEGITFTYPQNQQSSSANEEGLPQMQGIRIPGGFGNEQGIRIPGGFGNKQGIRVPGGFVDEQGITISYPWAQRSYGAKEQGFTVRLPQMQGIRIPGGFGNKQGIRVPGGFANEQGIRVPGGFGNEQGITISYPWAQRRYGAKEQGFTVRFPQMQGIRIPGGFGNRQDITLESALNFIGAFCSQYVKQADTLGDLKQYGSKLCDNPETNNSYW